MTKFTNEFKKFISRGNVFDMAVGVIVGSAFTAIVTSLTNNILKPITNWIIMLIFGNNSLSSSFTFLNKQFAEDGSVDLERSIYIDWGAFLSSILHFLIIAFVLFCLLKAINNIHDEIREAKKKRLTHAQRKELRKNGIKLRDKKAVAAFLEKEKKLAQEQAEREAEKERLAQEEYRANNPTSEDLLKLILEQMRKDKQ